MIVQEIKCPFIKIKVRNHKKYKNKLLRLLKKTLNQKLQYPNSLVSKSDWNLEDNSKKLYLKDFGEMLKPEYDKIFDYFGCNKIDMQNIWFHIYQKDDKYAWHTHPRCNFTNIYFLDLPNKKEQTLIKDMHGKQYKFNVQEGDLITFPAFVKHKSPKTKSTKTVIVFNSSFSYDHLN
jgi:hypothetical protein|tara:strand:- start:823 stop:1353 length:531 start_codon:yes stop_codon:yes gene_type:complete